MRVDQSVAQFIQQKLLSLRKPGEHFTASFWAEESQFLRWNAARVRQAGVVEDAFVQISWLKAAADGIRRCDQTVQITGLSWQDSERLESAVTRLRREHDAVPVDPYAVLPDPAVKEGSVDIKKGALLSSSEAADWLGSVTQGIDVAGIYQAGPVAMAMFNSEGLMHWFETETFTFDFSLYTKNQRAVKSGYSGTNWSQEEYLKKIEDGKKLLEVMERPARAVPRGKHRTFIAPAGVSDLIGMFNWGCVGEGAIRQGESPLRHVRAGEKKFSPLFELSEDFSTGLFPRFNKLGEVAPERTVLIADGKLQNTLVSKRSEKEYSVASNAAVDGEQMRAPTMGSGELATPQALKKLGTGLYLSNLHYLNWSDQAGGRVTGMTRYACLWVENGEIVAPIETMRWDDTIFSLFGDALEAVTREREVIPETTTYERRWPGGMRVPGMLLKEMNFTL